MRAIGIILAGGNSSRMGELSAKRAIAAMPVTGSYRAIDFSLSNMTNSNIQKVAVFTQYNSRSLNEHLNSSKWWDFGRKQGGLFVFTPTITSTNSYWYKGTADALYQNNIATLCFDKRGIGQSKLAGMKESELRIEDYVNDVRGWATLLSQDNRFLSVSIIGHSEGALIGLIASKNNTKISKYISIAGLGEPASKILKKQLDKQLIGQPQALRDQVSFCIDQLEQGKQIENVPVSLNTLFRPSVQPYMISWFRYNPQKEIAELSIPILIVQGTMDIQVSVEQSELLVMGNKKAEKVIIDNMDHVMKNSKSKDTQSQLIGSYNNPTSSLNGDLVKNIVEFLKK